MQDTDPTPASRLEHITDWLHLAGAHGVGPCTAHALVKAFGSPRAVLRAGHAALAEHVKPGVAHSLCTPPSSSIKAQAEAALEWAQHPSHHLLALDDPGYPQALAHIPDPPLLLYIRGQVELLARPGLAIVGSRNATAQGKANSASFATALSNSGVCVVSGLALGIDAAAHEGALRGPGSTIAVVGTGADLAYPARNRALAERIAVEGAVVSEYPLGTPPMAGNFPRRNRIISGLSSGVLVIEAAAQSGSLITARVAGEQGREVFALPGSIHAPLAKGCHKLIRDGARLVETVDEVLEAMRISPLAAMPAASTAAVPTETDCTQLLSQLGHDAFDLDTLLAQTGLSVGQLSMGLLALEMAGMIERLPGGKVQRVYS